jgi:hypothetical protein
MSVLSFSNLEKCSSNLALLVSSCMWMKVAELLILAASEILVTTDHPLSGVIEALSY